MSYTAQEARQELLNTLARATDEIGGALGELGEAYEQLDEHAGERLEAQLFGPVQRAYGRARRTHSEFAGRHDLPAKTFVPATPGHPVGVREHLDKAIEAIAEADEILIELQDSMAPVEVGDAELRAGLADVRRTLGEAEGAGHELVRVVGR